MKFYSKSNMTKNSTGSFKFNHNDNTAWSYGWWCFMKPINGKMVYNRYNYSSSTIKHQYAGRNLAPIDLVVETSKSLSDPAWIDDAIRIAKIHIGNLQAAIDKPRSQKAKNIERLSEITGIRREIETLIDLKHS